MCRDGSTTYAEAIRRALPDAVQISDRWHLWHNLAEAVRKEVAVHSACWAKAGPPPTEGRQAATTRERWQQIHALRKRGVGLLECARRLNLALNTVKRYDRVAEPERLVRAPPSTGPPWWIPTAITCASADWRIRPSPSHISSGRSGNWATPAARTSWSATSTRAVSRPTGRDCRPGAWPATSSPAPTTSRLTSENRSRPPEPPATRVPLWPTSSTASPHYWTPPTAMPPD
nr:transposase [Streptomyces olivaceus]